MEKRLEGKVALVTGAARGQGRSHALRLASEGAAVVGIDICKDFDTVPYGLATAEDLATAARDVSAASRRSFFEQADVRDQKALDDVVARAWDTFGRLDIVVANAGITTTHYKTWEVPDANWQDVIDVNLTGVWRTVKSAVPRMIEADHGGSIIITSSTTAIRSVQNHAQYATSKTGLLGLARTLTIELGPHNIRVNTIHPTGVATDMVLNPHEFKLFRPELENPGREDVSDIFRGFHLLPVDLVEPEDVSDAVAWLASDESKFITGVALPVDAGFSQRY